MAIKDFSVGVPYPTAADLNTYLIQQNHIWKPSDESVVSNINPQNDDHLVLPVTANTTYFVQGMLIYTGATLGDLFIRWSVPSGTTFDWVTDGLDPTATTLTDQISHSAQGAANQPSVGSIDAGIACAPVKGLLIVGSVGGFLRLAWSQATSSGTATVMKAGSYIMARRCF